MTRGFFVATVIVLAGCASFPDGPSVMVLPGSTKNFDQFRADDAECRQYASSQIGGKSVSDGANDTSRTTQQRYDFAFQQCMYARGHQIPMAHGAMPRQQRYSAAPPPPPPGTPPPAPAGYRVN